MLDDEQKKSLAKLPKAILVNFVADVQGMDKLLDKKIERLLLQSDKPKLIKKLTSTLKGLGRRRKFVNYWESSDFATELQYLVDDVMSLYPEQSEECLKLLELFINSTGSTLERVDDSNGDIGDIYRSLAPLWLQVAASCYEQERQTVSDEEQDILSQAWSEKVKAMANDNDYGTKDNLLRQVNQLFSKSEIEGLIEEYKYDYQTLINEVFDNKPDSHSVDIGYQPQINANSLEKSSLQFALTDLAWALGDIENYEEIYLYLDADRSFSRCSFDKLMSFLIEHKAYDVALRYLNADKQSNGKSDNSSNKKLKKLERLEWLNEIYSQQENTEAQLEALGSAFAIEPTSARFKQIMAIANPAQKASLRKIAYKLADQQQQVLVAIELWLEIGEFELANQVAVTRHKEFDELHYTTLTQWLKRLKQLPEDTNLIKVIIYRSLLNDILDNARTLAYGHAARYYKHLVKLDAFIDRSVNSYSSLDNHQHYVKALKDKHGKKYIFWDRVED